MALYINRQRLDEERIGRGAEWDQYEYFIDIDFRLIFFSPSPKIVIPFKSKIFSNWQKNINQARYYK